MNHFPQTTAALRRMARAIADLFKSKDDIGETYFGVMGSADRISEHRVKDYEEISSEPGWLKGWDSGDIMPKELVRGVHKETDTGEK